MALRAIAAEAANDHGYAWLAWSTTHIGHRLTGSANGARAEATADSLFRVAGITDVRFVPFATPAWQRGQVTLSVHWADSSMAVGCVALALTPDSALVNAAVLDAGNGLTADMARLGDRIKGSILLANLHSVNAPAGQGELHRSEKTALAVQYGAAGIIFINNVPGHVLLTGTASVTGEPVGIPAVCVAADDGDRLRARLRAGDVRGSIRMRNSLAPVLARNVVATIPGRVHPDEVLLVGAHLDSWDLATGATDNGLGAYSVLDLARCLHAAGLRPDRTIRFVLFMGEEQGLLGSKAWVNEMKASGELDHVCAMVNLDMSGDPRGFNVVGPAGWGELVKGIGDHMNALDTSFRNLFSVSPDLHSDHQPFMLAGVPTLAPICDLGEPVYRFYHSDHDALDLVDRKAMTQNVSRVGQLVWSLANAPELPGHFTDHELRDRLRAADLEEKLRLEREWRWE